MKKSWKLSRYMTPRLKKFVKTQLIRARRRQERQEIQLRKDKHGDLILLGNLGTRYRDFTKGWW